MTAPSLRIGDRLGPYEVEAFLGAGGMGEVYRCRDTRLDRIVAIKILRGLPRAESRGHAPGDAARRQRFHDEARAISALNHPHIRALYDVGTADEVDFLVMEYVEGQTLDSHLGKRALPVDHALRYATQIAEALSAAHRAGIAHSDIKPANIMIAASGVKLLDFGIATLWSDLHEPQDPDNADTATEPDAFPGTTAYMAPERLEGAPCDARTDIFACGVVLYEMLTGRKPFDAPSRARVIAAILEHDPLPVSSLNAAIAPELERAVMKCLAKSPEARWQTTADFASELTWIAQRPRPALAAAAIPTGAGRLGVAALAVIALAGLLSMSGSIFTTTASVGSPAPIRFMVEPPIGSPMTVNPGAFAVSPDGRTMAFTAAYGGKRMLWTRALDSYDSRPLPGTDDAWTPFWHPDSRRVAFVAGEHIRSVDIDSGSVTAVSTLPAGTPRGATASWGSQGEMVIATGAELLLVSGNGGTPTRLDLRAPPGARYNTPRFLPDGRRFLYHLDTEQADATGVYVGSIDGRDSPRRVLASDSQAQYVEPGYLLYVRDAAFMAQRVDPATLDAVGTPQVLPEHIAYFSAFKTAAFSASGRDVVAYRPLVSATELRWFDRTGRLLAALTSPAPYVNPALSPDGTRVAVTRFDPVAGKPDIWIVAEGGALMQLTNDAAIDEFATWSPDGTRVLFTSGRQGSLDLFVKPWTAAASEPAELILADDQNKLPFQWIGSRILFASAPRGGLLNARFFVKPGPAEAHPVPDVQPATEEGQLRLSPDGRWLAYVSDVTGSPHVFVRPFPSGPARWLVSPSGGFEPKWRADGRELFYLAPDRTLMAVDVGVAGGSFSAAPPRPLFRTNLSGAYLGSPFLNTRVRNEYEVSADGQRFLLNEPVEGPSAYGVRILVNWRALLSQR